MNDPISLLQLNSRVSATIAADSRLQDVWVTAETGDLRVSGGHCYLELLEKDSSTGRPLARMRAIIWASQYARISAEFTHATGQQLTSDLKVMVRVNVNFHPAFGLSAVITDINPDFTCGDLLRRRRIMIERLTEEGIIDMNRTLPWPDVAWRIAVISAQGAAGYGDFITHLYNNPQRLRFATHLFHATMQGEHAPQSIIEALDEIAARADEFDCVVIIRGGGATGDLASFDNYELAANVAQFPLPVIVGIGHERDVTILDYVAAVRVKTPTAAAEWLIGHSDEALSHIKDIASEIFRIATDRVSGGLRQIAYYEGLLPSLVLGRIQRAEASLGDAIPAAISHASDAILRRQGDRLGEASRLISQTCGNIMRRQFDKLESAAQLIAALSPEAVLRRGYSICRVDGHAVTDASQLSPGATMITTFANGEATSTVNNIIKTDK